MILSLMLVVLCTVLQLGLPTAVCSPNAPPGLNDAVARFPSPRLPMHDLHCQ
jgi:hypothetical protein